MDILSNTFLGGDQRLIDQIIREVKSQGIFDQFRKECISDVDTKPAYQNLRQRVESSVHGFLTQQTWNPEMNKNQVREMLRKNINESGFLETGVERIVDQVVNPKITTVFLPKVEDVVYKFLGIEKPIKVECEEDPSESSTFKDLLPRDLEAVSPEPHEEKDVHVKDEMFDVTMEEDESPSFEMINDGVKVLQEETSIDSQFSVSSEIVNQDSELSQKQDSVMSMNSSESRMSLPSSELTSKIEQDDVFLSQKSSDSNSKSEMVIDIPMEIDTEESSEKVSEALPTTKDLQNEIKSEDTNSRPKENDRKRERHHSSSDRSKSRNDKDKDRSRSDKHKKEEKESSKEQKTEKYRIPKLSDKIKAEKAEKEARSKDKEKSKEKSEIKSEKDKKYDKDRKSSKHSSERDKSKSDSKSKKDSKSDRKDKDKDEKKEKKDSSKSDKSKESRKSSSSSSSKRDSSSSKDKYKDKSKESSTSKKSEDDKKKNGHSSSRKDSSRSKKEDDKSKSSHKKDEKNEEDEKKKKRSSKDDHYDSKDKKNGRRSSDRDSDGPSNSKRLPTTPQKNCEKYSSQKNYQESSCSNMGSSAGDSGNSDKTENASLEHETLLLEMQKIKLPKFASNMQEAMKIMKIRKQLKKIESGNNVGLDSLEMKKLLRDIADLSKDNKQGKKGEKTQKEEKAPEKDSDVDNAEKVNDRPISVDITDFISSSNISMAKWNALEAKFMEQMGTVDYDSYESPYLDDEDYEIDSKKSDIIKNSKESEEDLKEDNQNEVIEGLDEQSTVQTSIDNLEEGLVGFDEEPQEKDEEDNMEVIEEIALDVTDDKIIEEEIISNVEDEKIIEDVIVANVEDEKMVEEEIVENVDGEESIQEVTSEKMEDIDTILELTVERVEDDEVVQEIRVGNVEGENVAVGSMDDKETIQEVKVGNVETLQEITIGNVEDNKTIQEVDVEKVEHEKPLQEVVNMQDEETENEEIVGNGKVEETLKEITTENVEEEKMIQEVPVSNVEDEKTSHELSVVNMDDEKPIARVTVGNVEEETIANFENMEETEIVKEVSGEITEPVEEDKKAGNELGIALNIENGSHDVKLENLTDSSPDGVSNPQSFKKAYVFMQKDAVTEEMIDVRMNGHAGKNENKIENEKENIILNNIKETENNKKNESHNKPKSVKVVNKSINLKNADVSTDNTQKSGKTVNRELDEGSRVSRRSGRRKNSFKNKIEEEKQSDEEEPCRGLEPYSKESWERLQDLMKHIQLVISKSVESLKTPEKSPELKSAMKSQKRKTQEVRFETTNNNDEVLVKRRRTKNHTSLPVAKPERVPKKQAQEENISTEIIANISVENKFSLPLSPAESEPSADKKNAANLKSRKKVVNNVTNKTEILPESPPQIKKRRGTPSKPAQRYTDEDLYKPRMLLRRSAKGVKDS